MQRREFLAASALAGVAPLTGFADAAAQQQTAEPEFYELRRYHTLYGPKQRQLAEFIGQVAIPAWNRIGIGPVGAFNVVYGENAPTMYVLLPHRDLASVANMRQRLMDDAEYRRAGAAVLDAPLGDPAYTRIESSLMRAFTHLPKLQVPAGAATGQPRIFELRRYESHGDPAAIRKIHMFNEGGEIAIFQKVGLTPVFFGESLVGPYLPNLTYMLTFPDMATRDAAWARFSADPEWKTLSANRFYADTVSAISDTILRPYPFSQI